MLKIFVTPPSGEKFDLEDSMDVFLNEKLMLSFNSIVQISIDDHCIVENFGSEASVMFTKVGTHILAISHHHGEVKHIHVHVKKYIVTATALNVHTVKICDVTPKRKHKDCK